MSIADQYKKTIAAYLGGFCAHSMDRILACFSADAQVHSPTQDGPKHPADFYPPVLARSAGVKFDIRAFYAGETPHVVAALLAYHKPMPDGSLRAFDCVDIFTFDEAGKISDLRIVFDTKKLAP
jgi:hypothetical protein